MVGTSQLILGGLTVARDKTGWKFHEPNKERR
jgi:hypothetical protein